MSANDLYDCLRDNIADAIHQHPEKKDASEWLRELDNRYTRLTTAIVNPNVVDPRDQPGRLALQLAADALRLIDDLGLHHYWPSRQP